MFARWWSQFQVTVAHNDKEAIAGMIKFPLEWENLKMRSINSNEEFLKRFPEIFTAEIKMKIAHMKPKKEDGYSINWRGRGERAANSYSMFFKAAPSLQSEAFTKGQPINQLAKKTFDSGPSRQKSQSSSFSTSFSGILISHRHTNQTK